MSDDALRSWLRGSEGAAPEEQLALLCFVAARSLEPEPEPGLGLGLGLGPDEAERTAAIRRAQLLLATGGDPRRPLELHGRAVSALAADLDGPARRGALAGALSALEPAVEGLPALGASLRLLQGDADLAWRAYAMALLAESLSDDDEELDPV